MNIVLIGVRGSGKSTLSRHLSFRTKRPVLSTDLLIQYESNGASIPDIIAREGGGWRYFRELEYQVVRKAAAMDGIIIDTGGGVVVDLDQAGEEFYSTRKINALKERGHILWLHGDVTQLAASVAQDANRPSLSQSLTLAQVMEERLPFYRRAADRVIDLNGKGLEEVLRDILSGLPFDPRRG